MIEEKVKEIIDAMSAAKESMEITAKASQLYNDAYASELDAKRNVSQLKRSLGDIIAPLGKNIIVKINNKTYCVFHNPKYGNAVIVEAIEPKDAEVLLAVNKLKGSGDGSR